MSIQIDRIQDDGNKFILHGNDELRSEVMGIFDNIGIGVNVSEGEGKAVNVLYTENNRDIVLRILKERQDSDRSRTSVQSE